MESEGFFLLLPVIKGFTVLVILLISLIYVGHKISVYRYLPLKVHNNSAKQIYYAIRLLRNLYHMYGYKELKDLFYILENSMYDKKELDERVVKVANNILKRFYVDAKYLRNELYKIKDLI